MSNTNLVKRIVTYVPKPVAKWLVAESTRRGLNESAILRELILERYNEANKGK